MTIALSDSIYKNVDVKGFTKALYIRIPAFRNKFFSQSAESMINRFPRLSRPLSRSVFTKLGDAATVMLFLFHGLPLSTGRTHYCGLQHFKFLNFLAKCFEKTCWKI